MEAFSQSALRAHLAKLAASINSAPPEVQAEAARHRAIEMHNAEIDKQKARKQEIRAIAKKARVPVENIKRMFANVRKG